MTNDTTHPSGGLQFEPDTIDNLQRRLRKIEGQVRGIQAMIADDRDCREIVTQIAATNKALEQVGFVMVSAGLTWCIKNPEQSAEAGYDVADVQKMSLKLA